MNQSGHTKQGGHGKGSEGPYSSVYSSGQRQPGNNMNFLSPQSTDNCNGVLPQIKFEYRAANMTIPDSLSSDLEEIREQYRQLYQVHTQSEYYVIQLEETLKAEMISSEEQRTYIQILKAALEQKLSSEGLNEVIGQLCARNSKLAPVDIYMELMKADKKLSEKEAKCEALNKDLNVHLNEAKNANTVKENLIAENRRLQTDYEGIKKSIDVLESEKETLLDYLDEMKIRWEKIENDYKTTISELERQVSDVQSHDTRRMQEIDSNYQIVLKEYESLRLKHEAMSEQFAQAKRAEEQLAVERNEKTSLGLVRAALEKKVAALEKKEEEIMKQLSSTKGRNEELEGRVDELAEFMKSMSSESDNLRNTCEDLRGKLEKERQARGDEVKTLFEQVSGLRVENRGLTDEIDSLTAKCQALNEEVKVLMDANEKKAKSIKELSGQLGDEKKKMHECYEEAAKWKEHSEMLGQEVEVARVELMKKSREYIINDVRAHAEFEMVQREKEGAEGELADLRRVIGGIIQGISVSEPHQLMPCASTGSFDKSLIMENLELLKIKYAEAQREIQRRVTEKEEAEARLTASLQEETSLRETLRNVRRELGDAQQTRETLRYENDSQSRRLQALEKENHDWSKEVELLCREKAFLIEEMKKIDSSSRIREEDTRKLRDQLKKCEDQLNNERYNDSELLMKVKRLFGRTEAWSVAEEITMLEVKLRHLQDERLRVEDQITKTELTSAGDLFTAKRRLEELRDELAANENEASILVMKRDSLEEELRRYNEMYQQRQQRMLELERSNHVMRQQIENLEKEIDIQDMTRKGLHLSYSELVQEYRRTSQNLASPARSLCPSKLIETSKLNSSSSQIRSPQAAPGQDLRVVLSEKLPNYQRDYASGNAGLYSLYTTQPRKL